LLGVGHQDEVASGERHVGGDTRAFVSDGSLGNLNHDFGSHGVNAGDVLGGDLLGFLGGFPVAADFFKTTI